MILAGQNLKCLLIEGQRWNRWNFGSLDLRTKILIYIRFSHDSKKTKPAFESWYNFQNDTSFTMFA